MAPAGGGERLIAGQQVKFERDRDAAEFPGELSPLWAELERVYRRVARSGEDAEVNSLSRTMRSDRPTPVALAALQERWNPVANLREIFGLSEFETDILLLSAGTAVDRRFSTALAVLQPDSPVPTLGLAASVLDKTHWSALSRMRPLRYWRLIEIGPGALLQAPLSIDGRSCNICLA